MKVLHYLEEPWNNLDCFNFTNKLRESVNISSRSDTGQYGEGNRTKCRIWSFFTLRDLFFVLVIIAIGIGCNISQDVPDTLKNEMIKNYKLSSSQISLLDTLYFVPTIILNLISGFLIDRELGVKLSTFVFSMIAIIGAALFTVGGFTSTYWIMLAGRLIFGFGKELATGVCMNYCLFSWYRTKIMNFIGCLYSCGNLAGTLIIHNVAPKLLQYLQRSASEKKSLDIVIALASALFVIPGGLAVVITYLKPKDSDKADVNITSLPVQNCNQVELKKATLQDVLSLPLVFWLLCIFAYLHSALNSFSHFSLDLLTSEEFGLSVYQAKNSMLAMIVVEVCLTLPLSLSVDVLGRNSWYVILAQMMATLAYFFFCVSGDPFAGMILVGLSNAIYNSAILPMFAYPVEKQLIGTCYGIVSMFWGLGTLTAPLIVKAIIERHGYSSVISFYFTTSVLSLICIIMLWILDKKCAGVLSMTPKQRKNFEHSSRIEGGVIMKRIGTSPSLTSVQNLSYNTVKRNTFTPKKKSQENS